MRLWPRLLTGAVLLTLLSPLAFAATYTVAFPPPGQSFNDGQTSILTVPDNVLITDLAVRVDMALLYGPLHSYELTYLPAVGPPITAAFNTSNAWVPLANFNGLSSAADWELKMLVPPPGLFVNLDAWHLRVNEMPEPSTYFLVGFGACVMMVLRKRLARVKR